MLQMIIDWLITAIAEAMNLFCNWFFSAFTLDVARFVDYFPALGTGYSIFRGLGYGLVFVFAALAMVQFFVPSLFGGRQPDDRPLGVLAKAAIAAMLVFSGNYLLEYIIELSKIPYDRFMQIGITGNINFSLKNVIVNLAETKTGITAALSIIEFALTAALAYNILKLIIEICERYLMVAVLLYTSPPFFAMAASNATMNVFKSWVKMFISSCAMMSVSVFFMKVILSGLVTLGTHLATTGEFFLRIGLTFAMCKIAQHADEYLSKLGLGTATTGRPLWDDMIAAYGSMAKTMGGGKGGSGGGGGSRGSVLGAMSRAAAGSSALAAGVIGAANSVKEGFVNAEGQQSLEDIRRNAESGWSEGKKSSGHKSPVASFISGKRQGLSNKEAAAQATNTAVSNAKRDFVNIAMPGAANRRDAARAEQKALDEKSAATAAAKTKNDAIRTNQSAEQKGNAEFGQHTTLVPMGKDAELLEKVEAGGYTPREAEAKEFNENIGPGDGITMNADGELGLSSTGVASGMTYDEGNNSFGGNEAAVEEVIARNFDGAKFDENATSAYEKSLSSDNPDTPVAPEEIQEEVSAAKTEAAEQMQSAMVNTVQYGSADVADRLAFDSRAELSGNDELGSAVVGRVGPQEALDESGGKFINFQTQNLESVNVDGKELSGGHQWSAAYKTEDGTTKQVTGINEEAYSAKVASGEDVSGWTKTRTEAGRTTYTKIENISDEQYSAAEASAQAPRQSTFSASPRNNQEHIPQVPVQTERVVQSSAPRSSSTERARVVESPAPRSSSTERVRVVESPAPRGSSTERVVEYRPAPESRSGGRSSARNTGTNSSGSYNTKRGSSSGKTGNKPPIGKGKNK